MLLYLFISNFGNASIAIVAYIVVSKLTKKPPQEVIDMFNYAKSFDEVEGEEAPAAASGIQMSSEQFATLIRRGEEKLEKMAGSVRNILTKKIK